MGLVLSPYLALLTLPYLLWILALPSKASLTRRVPRLAARIPVFLARHLVICGSLLYGSFRSRRLVL
jgi:hypothetical protein